MSLDTSQAACVAGGETFDAQPLQIEGLFLLPPTKTISTQVTGNDSTVLRAGFTAGRARLIDSVQDFVPTEVGVVTTSGAQYSQSGVTPEFAVGNAVWATAVAIQHRNAAAISIVWVFGTLAALADAVAPTQDEIKTAVDGTDQGRYTVLGDILFVRTADTVVDHYVSNKRRVAYVDEANKTSVAGEQDDQDGTMGLRYWGHVDYTLHLPSVFAASAGDQVAKTEAPALPFGGLLGQLEYIPTVDAAGAGGDISLRPNVNNPGAAAAVAADGDDLQLLLATAILGTTTSNTRAPESYTTLPNFKPGATLSVELQAKPTAFTAGSGTLRQHVWEYIPSGGGN